MQSIHAKAKRIRLAIFDVDGVLTDGSLYLTDGGDEIKAGTVTVKNLAAQTQQTATPTEAAADILNALKARG